MTGVLAVLALGFVLGMRHAADPDHVIAISTIVTRYRTPRAAAWIGAVWGLGHTLTILVVGGGIIVFGWIIPQRVGLSFEFGVSVMLIVLGLLNLKGAVGLIGRRASIGARHSDLMHSHTHAHGDYVHTHPHGHHPEYHPHTPRQTPVAWLDRQFGTSGLFLLLRPLLIGIVHGLAGSASVALLVLATIRDARWGLVYLLLFGAGTVLGMLLITVAISWPLASRTWRPDVFPGALRVVAGLISIAFGMFLAYHVGITQGLFVIHT